MAGRLTLAQAAALGTLQGPAELLPVSSSGHLVLVPALLGWRYGELDAELRKSFEVALHAGTAAALLIGLLVLGQVPTAVAVAGIAFVVVAGVGAERTGARRHEAVPVAPAVSAGPRP